MLRSEFRDQMAVCLGEPVDSHKHSSAGSRLAASNAGAKSLVVRTSMNWEDLKDWSGPRDLSALPGRHWVAHIGEMSNWRETRDCLRKQF